MKTKKNDLLSVDNYINESLYNKKFGYYMNKNPFGKKGDFITAPGVSILFSEMISIWVISFWENLGCPKKFNLIELGAGDGEMMRVLNKTFERFPKFKSACKINIFEKSDFLKKIQKKNISCKNITWIKNLDDINDSPCIFVANEFFDALPVKQFIKKKKNWYERYIKFTGLKKNKYVDLPFDMKKFEDSIKIQISKNQKFIEYSPLCMSYLKTITKKIKSNGGGVLIIDYGYLNKKIKNTLQSVHGHKYKSVLENFRESDITYNINFNLIHEMIRKLGSFNSSTTIQKDFLIKLGILKRAEILTKNMPFTKKADIYFRIKRLISKNEMGELFKVMLVTNKNNNFQLGF